MERNRRCSFFFVFFLGAKGGVPFNKHVLHTQHDLLGAKRVQERERNTGEGEWQVVRRRKHNMRRQAGTHIKPTRRESEVCTLFINFLPMNISNQKLRLNFGTHGVVTDAFVLCRLRGGLTYRYAFVRFARKSDAIKAIERAGRTNQTGVACE